VDNSLTAQICFDTAVTNEAGEAADSGC